jgi:hypothetical protein
MSRFYFIAFLILLLKAQVFAQIPGTVAVSAPVAPPATNSPFGATDTRWAKGGYGTWATNLTQIQSLTWLPAARRQQGMLQYVSGDNTTYQLGSDLVTWTPQSSGTTESQIVQGFILPLATGRSLTNYWAFGDSQTVGQMGSVLSTNWTDSAGRILPQYRYPNIIADKFGLNLTNGAYSGSGMRWTPAFDYGRAGPFTQMGYYLPLDWKGLVSVMVGYNDSGAEYASNGWNRHFLNGAMAMYGRALINDYVANGTNGSGVKYVGWNPGGPSVLTNYCDPAGCFPTNNAFPMGQWGVANRMYTVFQGAGDYLTIQSTNHANVLVFYQTSQGNGQQWVMVGTNVVGTIFAETPAPRDYENFAGAFLIRNIPTGVQNITVTNISGAGRIFAFGFLPELPASTDRTLIVGTPIELFSPQRSAATLNAISRAELRAATLLADWNVGFADTQNAIDVTTDMIPGGSDPNHVTPSGQAHMAYTIQVAKRASQTETVGSPWAALPPADSGGVGSFSTIYNTGQLYNNGFLWSGTGDSTQPNPGVLFQRATNGTAFIAFYRGPYAGTNEDWRISVGGSDRKFQLQRPTGTNTGYIDAPISVDTNGIITLATTSLVTTGNGIFGTGTISAGLLLAANSTNIAFLDFYNQLGAAGNSFRFARGGNESLSLIQRSNDTDISYVMNVTSNGSAVTWVAPTFYVAGNGTYTGTLQANGAFVGQTNGQFYGNMSLGNQINDTGLTVGAGASATGVVDFNSGPTNIVRLSRDTGQKWAITVYSNNVSSFKSYETETNGRVHLIGTHDLTGSWQGTGAFTNIGTTKLDGAVTATSTVDITGSTTIHNLLQLNLSGNVAIYNQEANGLAFYGGYPGAPVYLHQFFGNGNVSLYGVTTNLSGAVVGANNTKISGIRTGTAVLVAGTKTVSDATITANSNIQLTSQVDGGTVGFLRVSARSASTSFTITSSSALDTSTVGYVIFEP